MRNDRERGRRRRGMVLVGLLAAAFLILMGVWVARQNGRLSEKEEQLRLLQEEYEEETQRTADLQKQQEYMQSDEYLEEMAKEKWGLVYDSELIFMEAEEEP